MHDRDHDHEGSYGPDELEPLARQEVSIADDSGPDGQITSDDEGDEQETEYELP
jgi:hypothetical protein